MCAVGLSKEGGGGTAPVYFQTNRQSEEGHRTAALAAGAGIQFPSVLLGGLLE